MKFVNRLPFLSHDARQARQFLANVFLPALEGRYPMASRPGRIVANVLLMPTLQLGNPVRLLVLVEPDDFSGLALKWCFWLHDATVYCLHQ
jgi:hypothetical protein